MHVLGVAQDPSWSQMGIWPERIPFDGFELHETIKSQVVCLMGFFAHQFLPVLRMISPMRDLTLKSHTLVELFGRGQPIAPAFFAVNGSYAASHPDFIDHFPHTDCDTWFKPCWGRVVYLSCMSQNHG